MKTKEIIKVLTGLTFSDRPLDPVAKEAVAAALPILRGLADVEALAEIKGGTVIPGAIVSAPLAPLLRPYHGCPRGAMGLPWTSYNEHPYLDGTLRLLNDSAKYAITGQDESFICVPEMWFKTCVSGLQKTGARDRTRETPLSVTEAELFDRYLASGWEDIIDFYEYRRRFIENGGTVKEAEHEKTDA